MKKHLLIVFVIVLLCCGCTADYTLTINEDLSVKESAKALENAEFFNQYQYSSAQRIIGNLLNPNLEYLNSNGFSVEHIFNNDDAGVLISNEYDSIEKYLEISEFPKQYGENVEYIEKDDTITLRIKGMLSSSEQNQDGKYVIDDSKVSIVLTNRTAISSNADIVDEESHKYTWKINNTEDERVIEITFNKKVDNSFPMIEVIAIIVTILLVILAIFIGKKIVDIKGKRNKL